MEASAAKKKENHQYNKLLGVVILKSRFCLNLMQMEFYMCLRRLPFLMWKEAILVEESNRWSWKQKNVLKREKIKCSVEKARLEENFFDQQTFTGGLQRVELYDWRNNIFIR